MLASTGDQLADRITWIGFSVTLCIVVSGVLFQFLHSKRGSASFRSLADHFKTRPRWRSQQEMRALAQGNSVTLGKILHSGWWWRKQPMIIPESARCYNVLNLGPVGSGKTTFYLMTYLAQDISRSNVCAVVFDGQRAITEEVLALAAQYQRQVVVYPDAGFNPLRGPGSPEANATRFGDVWAQVEAASNTGPARFYFERAQTFLRKIVSLYQRAYQQPMILRELLELCLSEQMRARLLAVGAGTPEARAYLTMCGGWSRSDFDTNLAGLVNFLDRLLLERNAWLYNQRLAPTLLECIEQKKVIVIREGGARDTSRHTAGLLYMTLLQAYIERRNVQPTSPLISVYLDEAHLYFNSNFPTFIATARKKRVALHLGFQSLKQLESYGPIITTNCRTWILHGGLDADDALVVADTIGKRTYRTVSWTTGGGRPRQTIAHYWDYLVQPHQVRGLGENEALVLTVEGQKREVAAHAFVEKPSPPGLVTTPYEPLWVPTAPPQTIWEECEAQQASAAHQIQDQASSQQHPAT